MAEPLTRGEAETEGLLAEAIRRLERALQRLEAGPGAASPSSDPGRERALVIELDAIRLRQNRLAEAATGASAALGRAMAEVRRTLDEDAERQGLLDFAADGLEAERQPAEEGEADAPSSGEEPAA